jgi:hypothetical protein
MLPRTSAAILAPQTRRSTRGSATRKLAAQASKKAESRPTLSPRSIACTPLFVGLRRCRYVPSIRSLLAKNQGASAPRSTRPNSWTHYAARMNPASYNTEPKPNGPRVVAHSSDPPVSRSQAARTTMVGTTTSTINSSASIASRCRLDAAMDSLRKAVAKLQSGLRCTAFREGRRVAFSPSAPC